MKRLVILLAAVATAFGFKTLDPLSDEFIEAINNAQPHWKAGRNFHRDTPMSYIEILLGTLPEIPHNHPMQYHDARHIEIPTSFDAREEWPHCPSIGEIRDQGSCGSCWAVATAEVITDRICIHSNGTLNFRVSAQDLLSCCNFCDRGNGCEGGWPGRAWQYWVEEGIVSGGPYGSNQGCRPYEEKPCEHDNRIQSSLPICDGILPNPECVQECEPGYTIPYHKDRIFGQNWYKLNMDPEQIQLEIMKNGPVGASFRVYEDFGLYYTGGVYYHTMGKELDGHSVKIIGWGVKDNLPYWLVANSWNTHWGDKGYFKILRGSNECKIENSIIAGIPKIEHV